MLTSSILSPGSPELGRSKRPDGPSVHFWHLSVHPYDGLGSDPSPCIRTNLSCVVTFGHLPSVHHHDGLRLPNDPSVHLRASSLHLMMVSGSVHHHDGLKWWTSGCSTTHLCTYGHLAYPPYTHSCLRTQLISRA